MTPLHGRPRPPDPAGHEVSYFTFFICVSHWPPLAGLVPWIDRLLEPVRSKRTAMVTASGPAGQPADLEGRYASLRGALVQSEASSFSVSTKMVSGAFDAYVFVERERLHFTPDYVQYLNPSASQTTADSGAPRIASASYRLAAFRGYREEGARVAASIEQAFEEWGGLHAWGAATRFPISSPYQLIGEASGGRSPRLIDVDHRSHVERLGELNWLSAAHVDRIQEPQRLRALADVPTRFLPSGGLFFDTSRASKSSLETLGHCLDRLVRIPLPGREASLILGARGLDAVGMSTLEHLFGRARVTVHSPGFAEVSGLEEVASEDPLEFERILERLRPPGQPVRVRQHLAAHAGVIDPDHLYYRLSPFEADDPRILQVRVADGPEPARMPLTLLLDRDAAAADAGHVAEALRRWLDGLLNWSTAAGEVTLREPIRADERAGVPCLVTVLDASRMREPAFHALVLTLDEVNDAKPLVRYLVLGNIGEA